MRIGVDFNGVVADSSATKVALAKRFFDVELESSHSIRHTLGNSPLSNSQYSWLQQITYWTSEFLTTPPKMDVTQTLATWLDQDYQVYCVSNLAAEGVQFGRQWLAEHQLPRNMLVSVGRGGEKAWVLQCGFSVYVDDKPSILSSLATTVPYRFLLSTPYNQDQATPQGVCRIETFSDLRYHLERIKRLQPA